MAANERIRWDDDDPSREYAAFTGSVGPPGWNWAPFGIYEEAGGPVAGLKTHFLASDLPGQGRRRHFGHPDDLKAEAERWLEEFASSLGAVFPPPGTVTVDEAALNALIDYADDARIGRDSQFLCADAEYKASDAEFRALTAALSGGTTPEEG